MYKQLVHFLVFFGVFFIDFGAAFFLGVVVLGVVFLALVFSTDGSFVSLDSSTTLLSLSSTFFCFISCAFLRLSSNLSTRLAVSISFCWPV